MSLIEDLKWRYATKKMNGKTVPQEKIDYILEATRLSPASTGLQPYEIFVITNKELLEKIKSVAHNQSQITDCSHLLVFTAWDYLTEDRVNNFYKKMNAEREIPDSETDGQRKGMLNVYSGWSPEVHQQHSANQAHIAFGIAIAAAAEQRVDATPMGGFDNAAVDELLNLKEKGLKSVVLLPLGHRDVENDWLYPLKKVRTPKEELFAFID